jgi:beta-glucanase (GH16 family)
VKGHPDCAASYPARPGFTLALVEEFATPIDLVDDPIWTYSDGCFDSGSAARFTKDGISFANGYLQITMTNTSVGSSFSYAEEDTVSTRNYRSGELRTKYNNYRYGRYEASFKAPRVTVANPEAAGGYVASLFTFRTPRATHWRHIGWEQTGYSSTSLTSELLNGDNQAAWSGAISSTASHVLSSSARTTFHEYAFVWLPTSITWYVDGVQKRQVTGTGLPIPILSAKIMMNLWGGAFGGDLSSNEYPLTTQYDWFRFYKWDGDTTYPTSDPANDLPHTDLDGSKNNSEDGVTYIPPDPYAPDPPEPPDAGSSDGG